MCKIVGFGECVVDFIPAASYNKDDSPVFRACPGGSVANLCVAVKKLGIESEFIGAVGNDYFGRMLRDVLKGRGVLTDNMIFTDECGTILAFVHPTANGGRDYSFANAPGADKMTRMAQVSLESIRTASILHVSSNAMACGPTLETQDAILTFAKENGVAVSYDVNYRPANHKSLEAALRVLRLPLGRCDIVKATEEELELVAGAAGRKGAEALLQQRAKIVLVTKGARGCDYYTAHDGGSVPAENTRAVDTTGAGDAFLGAFLAAMLRRKGLAAITAQGLRAAVRFANRAASISVTRYGAMEATPSLDELGEWDTI